ncbi:hypothetical protein ACLUWW_03215 [Ligilactobacillus salivarius]
MSEALETLDDITKQLLENGIPFQDIEDMDSEAFFKYLERQSESNSKLSAEEFYNQF